MTKTVRQLTRGAVRLAWTMINDFMPKRTLMEIGFYLDDRRSQLFNTADASLRVRLEARLTAARAVRAAMVQSQASEEQVRAVQERISVIEDLLHPPNLYRDVFAGSLSSEQEVGDEWTAASNHPTSTAFRARKAREIIGRSFANRELHDESVRLRTQIQVQKRMLMQDRNVAAAGDRSSLDARLSALDFVERVMASPATRTAQARAPRPVPGAAAKAASKGGIRVE